MKHKVLTHHLHSTVSLSTNSSFYTVFRYTINPPLCRVIFMPCSCPDTHRDHFDTIKYHYISTINSLANTAFQTSFYIKKPQQLQWTHSTSTTSTSTCIAPRTGRPFSRLHTPPRCPLPPQPAFKLPRQQGLPPPRQTRVVGHETPTSTPVARFHL